MMRINYSDTQLTHAQNKSSHTVLIDRYVISYFNSKTPILNFMFLQHFFGVKFQLTNIKICQLSHMEEAVYITFNTKGIYKNEFIIKNSQFIYNKNVTHLLYIRVLEYIMMSNSTVKIENCLFSYNVNNSYYGSIIMFDGQIKNILISSCKFYSNRKSMMIKQFVAASPLVGLKRLFTHFVIANTSFSSLFGKFTIAIYNAKLHLKGPVIFCNIYCYKKSIIEIQESIIYLTNYIEFSTNKVNSTIKYFSKNYFYLILTENARLNISHNNFTQFANTHYVLTKLPLCCFQYLNKRQLDTHHGNYSIIFEKNYERFTQNAYNNLHTAHCTWLNISAYKTALPFMVNKQYIQYINASGKFDMLPQSSHQKTLCYCSNNTHYDCYKEILEPAIYPGQTITISLLNYRNSFEYERIDVVVDTALPTACIVTNSSEIKQSIKHDGCSELKYSIAFLSDN